MTDTSSNVRHLVNVEWTSAGEVALAGKGYELRFDPVVPNDNGVYQLVAHGARQIYVGESKNLSRRMRDYAKAGWTPERKAATNRTVQGWIYRILESEISAVELLICRRASFETSAGDRLAIDLARKHDRRTIEGLTILAIPEGYELINK